MVWEAKTKRTSSKRQTTHDQPHHSRKATAQFASKKSLSDRTQSRLTTQSKKELIGRKRPIPADKKLRIIGHQLKPCIILSESSLIDAKLSPALIQEAKARLNDHELIKVKLRFLERHHRQEVLHNLLAETDARALYIIGKVALIFKASNRFSEKLSNIERFRQLI